MSSDWPLRNITEITDSLNHKRVPLSGMERQSRQGQYPYYGASGIVDYIDDYIFNGTYLLISEDGENLRSRNTPIAFKAHGKFWVNNHAHILDEKEEGILDYLEYYFSQLNLSPYITGAVQPKLNKGNLQKIDVRVPPLEQRLQINDILNGFSKKIHLNQQTNETLEAMAQAMFKSWFVDFDPVRAKMKAKTEGFDPDKAAMAAIAGVSLEQNWQDIEAALNQKLASMTEAQRTQLQHTAELFPDELVESELGEVPKGWGIANFGKLIEYMIGGDWGKEEPTNKHTERVRIFRGTDLPEVFQGNDEPVPVRFVQSKKLKTRKLQHGDIVFEVSGGSKNQSTGRNLLITNKLMNRFSSDLEPASFCKLMRPISIAMSFYLGVHLRKAYDDGLMWQFQVQSTGISNFQTNTFMEQHYLVTPPDSLLEKFQKQVEPIFDKIYTDENSKLKKLRDTLLPKLISGEVEV
ncbi:MAG: restriction endonuclease subunit S [Balneola sp.]